ncbi:uncharacterized protein A4U43_C02F17450 [Asparagus officinalis]|uniref:Uncharacterized protein n=1 Tax=Asparagus officinalis TaxID=4686 RepID=A0A5P1FKS9_ASPOF|nr:uncharacterized protein A4U43_C02F17450 [Asparagus officinalis]
MIWMEAARSSESASSSSSDSSSDSTYRTHHYSPPASSSYIPDSTARRIDSLEEGVYERLRDTGRRQEEIRAEAQGWRHEVISRIDGSEQKLDATLSLLQPSTPSPGRGPST